MEASGRDVNAAQHILVNLTRLYRWGFSPAKALLFGPLAQCRFFPSCSEYAIEVVTRHGAMAGSWLALKRVCRCHPWGGCGCDPVPRQPGATPVPFSSNLPQESVFKA